MLKYLTSCYLKKFQAVTRLINLFDRSTTRGGCASATCRRFATRCPTSTPPSSSARPSSCPSSRWQIFNVSHKLGPWWGCIAHCIASHPAAPAFPNIFLWNLLLREKWTETWKCQLNLSSTFEWHTSATKRIFLNSLVLPLAASQCFKSCGQR